MDSKSTDLGTRNRLGHVEFQCVNLAIVAAIFFLLGCSKDARLGPPGPLDLYDTLWAEVCDGVWGWPSQGTHIYLKDRAETVNYYYSLKRGNINLRVSLDGQAIPDSGWFVMDRDHYLKVDCESKVRWKLSLEKHVYYCSPAVGADGTVYVTTGIIYNDYDTGSLYAVNPDGTIKWSYDFPDIPYTPAIGEDGTILVQDRHNVVYAITPWGELKWRFDAFESDLIVFYDVGQRIPAVGRDGTVYIASDGLYALDPETGTKLWRFNPRETNSCRQSPVIGADGTIYIFIHQDDFYAVNPDGSEKWHAKLDHVDEMAFSCPAIDVDGTLYVGAERQAPPFATGLVYAFRSDGTKKWKYEVEGAGRVVRASPTIGGDGTIYVATKAARGLPALVIALSPEGVKLWEFAVQLTHVTPDDIYSTPSVGADGLIYFGAEDSRFYALNPDGTLNWSMGVEYGLNWSSGAIIEDGTLYIGTHHENLPMRGNLYAILTTSNGYAASPWPRFRNNNRNNGRYGGI